jgi:cell division protein FtsL
VTAPAIHNRPIRQPDERGFSEALRLTGLTFLVAAPFVLYVGLSANMIQEEYRLSKLVAQRSQLVRDRERLTLQRAALQSPEAVLRTARDKLGMTDEDPQELTVGVVPETKPAVSGAAPEETAARPSPPQRAAGIAPHEGRGASRLTAGASRASGALS